jgi:multimeric flavodoxin WrbA
MRILAISGSPRIEKRSSTLKLVKVVAQNTGCEYDLISLAGKKIQGCLGCMGCVDDNICKLKDDFTPLRDKIIKVDAFILGGCNFFSTLNASMHCFLERWYQFRHREKNDLWGKPAVTVSVGGRQTQAVAKILEQFCIYNFIQVVDKIDGLGAPGCFYCGYGETCKVGAIQPLHGDGFKITKENTPCVTKDPVCMEKACQAGKKLGKILKNGHDRDKAAQEVRESMNAMRQKQLEKANEA